MSLLKQKSRASSAMVLGAGEHTVKVASMVECSDQQKNFNASEIEVKEEWSDPTPQIAVVFRATNGTGVFTHRFNVKGFVRFSELDATQQKATVKVAGKVVAKYFSAGAEGYAIDRMTGERLESAERTDKCIRMLDDMSARCGNAEGSAYEEMVGKELNIVIEENGQGNLRITRTKKANAVVADTVEDESIAN